MSETSLMARLHAMLWVRHQSWLVCVPCYEWDFTDGSSTCHVVSETSNGLSLCHVMSETSRMAHLHAMMWVRHRCWLWVSNIGYRGSYLTDDDWEEDQLEKKPVSSSVNLLVNHLLANCNPCYSMLDNGAISSVVQCYVQINHSKVQKPANMLWVRHCTVFISCYPCQSFTHEAAFFTVCFS